MQHVALDHMWYCLGQSPRNHIFIIPVPQTVDLNFFNDTKCVGNFSICEDKKLKKEDIYQVSVKFIFKLQEFALEKPNYFIPETRMPLQTGMKSQMAHCHLHHVLTQFVQNPGNFHHLPPLTSAPQENLCHPRTTA